MRFSAVLAFMQSHVLAVEASVSSRGAPQAAVVGIAVTDDGEIVFDTLASTRKAHNLRQNAKLAFVIGGVQAGEQRTVQFEGIADEPEGEELNRLKAVYFAKWPTGPQRQQWPGIMYVRVKPTWIRYSDFSCDPPEIIEWNQLDELPWSPRLS